MFLSFWSACLSTLVVLLIWGHLVDGRPAPCDHDLHEHLVLLTPDAPPLGEILQRIDLHQDHERITHVYENSVFRGFAASMNAATAEALGSMLDTLHVEKSTVISAPTDGTLVKRSEKVYPTVRLADLNTSTTHVAIGENQKILTTSGIALRNGVPWGLERISSVGQVTTSNALALDYTYGYRDRGNNSLGNGVNVYVIDGALDVKHPTFGGRARRAWSCETIPQDQTVASSPHGTHVAGTAAGSGIGVASSANIIGLQVFDSRDSPTSNACIVQAISKLILMHDVRRNLSEATHTRFAGSVVNLSLGGPAVLSQQQVMNLIIGLAVDHGIHFAIAAGNAGMDACDDLTASSGGLSQVGAVVVGAVNITGKSTTWSNFGPCVDVYAPGEKIWSSVPGNATITDPLGIYDGTSMAAPHVAGVMASLMAEDTTLALDPRLMKKRLVELALKTSERGLTSNGAALEILNNGVLGLENLPKRRF